MKIERFCNVSKSELFPCTAKEIKSSKLCELESIGVIFGIKHEYSFSRWDHYDYKTPDIQGTVVANAKVESSINCKKDNVAFYKYFSECTLYLYAVKSQEYPETAQKDFSKNVLPTIYNWFQEQVSKPENARLKASELLVDWFENKHEIIVLKAKQPR